MVLTCLQVNLTEDNLELKMRVQVLEKENSLLTQEKVGAIKMGAELKWYVYSILITAKSQFISK